MISHCGYLQQIDELHTITSLAGFEALIRQYPVVVWGMPFMLAGAYPGYLPLSQAQSRAITFEALLYMPYAVIHVTTIGRSWDSLPHLNTCLPASRSTAANRRIHASRHTRSPWRKLGYLLETPAGPLTLRRHWPECVAVTGSIGPFFQDFAEFLRQRDLNVYRIHFNGGGRALSRRRATL